MGTAETHLMTKLQAEPIQDQDTLYCTSSARPARGRGQKKGHWETKKKGGLGWVVEGEREGSLRPGEESVFSFWRYFYFKLIGPSPVGMAPHGFVPANLMGKGPGKE